MKIYIYGIIDSKGRIDNSIKGLRGTRVYNIPYHNIGVVASDLNQQIQNIGSDRIVEHEIVIERLMQSFTVLPARFPTVFDRKKNVLSIVKDYYSDFAENLDRLCNKVEFGIKVIWSGDTVRKRIINSHPKDNQRVPVSDDWPGKSFIKEKFQKYKIDKKFKDEAERYIAVIDNFFSGYATEKKLERLKSENLLLSAVYLIEKEKQSDFRQAFERLRSTFGDFKCLFSGPWPPYNFIILKRRSIHQDISEPDMFDGVPLGQDLTGRKII